MSITPSIEGTDSHIDLDDLVRQTEKSFSDVEMDDAEAARVNQGEELEILPGRYEKWLKTSSALNHPVIFICLISKLAFRFESTTTKL